MPDDTSTQTTKELVGSNGTSVVGMLISISTEGGANILAADTDQELPGASQGQACFSRYHEDVRKLVAKDYTKRHVHPNPLQH